MGRACDTHPSPMDGCLVIHGLTGTPATVATIREALLSAGFRVAAPCLAGHGVGVDDLSRASWQDWYETVRIAFMALRREVDRVFYAGISLGALLGLKLALDEGWGVRALALMSVPLRLNFIERIAVPVVRHTPIRWIVRSVPKNLKKSVADPVERLRYEQLSLPDIPVKAVFEITDLQRILILELPRLSNPMLILHGLGDRVAPFSNVKLLKEAVASDIVETKILPASRHVLSMDSDREEVAKSVVEFFKRFA